MENILKFEAGLNGATNNLLDERGGEDGPHYYLAGRALNDGDQIEVYSPLGWLCGEFEWSSVISHLPRLVVLFEDRADNLFVVVLLPGSTCRWPLSPAQHIS